MSPIRLTSVSFVMMFAAPPGDVFDRSVMAVARRSAPRSAMQTLSPISAKRSAAARPIPEAPPVMTAAEPGKRTDSAMVNSLACLSDHIDLAHRFVHAAGSLPALWKEGDGVRHDPDDVA